VVAQSFGLLQPLLFQKQFGNCQNTLYKVGVTKTHQQIYQRYYFMKEEAFEHPLKKKKKVVSE